MRTPNDLVNGELVRFPIYINVQIRHVHYWLKLTQMNEHRLLFKAHRNFCNLDERGKMPGIVKVWGTYMNFESIQAETYSY